MEPITIRIAGDGDDFPGSFIVERQGRAAGGMGWDEMLGHVIALTLKNPQVRARRDGTKEKVRADG